MVEEDDVSAGPPSVRPKRPTADHRGTISQRLNYLFEIVRTPDGKRYTPPKVAAQIRAKGGKITAVYINKVRKGDRTPGPTYVQALADFFGVPITFFYEREPAALDGPALSDGIALRSVQSMMLRATRLSLPAQKALGEVIDAMLRAESKDPGQIGQASTQSDSDDTESDDTESDDTESDDTDSDDTESDDTTTPQASSPRTPSKTNRPRRRPSPQSPSGSTRPGHKTSSTTPEHSTAPEQNDNVG